MAEHNHYVPILKGRQGEYTALAALSDSSRAGLTPLIEVPPIPWDFENEAPAKSIDDHLDPVAGNVTRHWGTDRGVFVDLGWIAEDSTSDGAHPLAKVFTGLRELGAAAIPAMGLSCSADYLSSVRDVISEDGRGVLLRLEVEDLRSLPALGRELGQIRSFLGIDADQIDLLLDFKDFDAGQAPAIEMAASMSLAALPEPDAWRSLALAGGSFPLNLSGFQGEARVTRADWDVWRSLAINRGDELPRKPAFSDYAVQHPEPEEVDPRLMRMSAAARYATPTEWLIIKKKNVRDHGFEQFHEIAADLISRAEYRGAEFSAADKAIEGCATKATGPGNATTWRRIATNHHLATVLDQIANLP